MAEKISSTKGEKRFFSWINKIRNINIPVDLPQFRKYRPPSLPMVEKGHACCQGSRKRSNSLALERAIQQPCNFR